jgi:hypothetical protein
MKINFDVDIDMADRDQFLKLVAHTPASILRDGVYTKHNTGVYFQNIPSLPLEQISTLDYKQAEIDGWFKVDFLNNSVYQGVHDEAHLTKLMNTEPMWELLEHQEVVSELFQISNYPELMKQYKPHSVEHLAMLLAIIRPAKKHLIGKTWAEIESDVWVKPPDAAYHFKKSHAVAYAMVIVVQLNLICENLTGSLD